MRNYPNTASLSIVISLSFIIFVHDIIVAGYKCDNQQAYSVYFMPGSNISFLWHATRKTEYIMPSGKRIILPGNWICYGIAPEENMFISTETYNICWNGKHSLNYKLTNYVCVIIWTFLASLSFLWVESPMTGEDSTDHRETSLTNASIVGSLYLL